MDGIVHLRFRHSVRHERHWLQAATEVLTQSRTHCIPGRVGRHCERFTVIGYTQHWSRQHCYLEIVKGFLLDISPYERNEVSCQVGQWRCNLTKLVYEATVVTSQSDEGADILCGLRNRPL